MSGGPKLQMTTEQQSSMACQRVNRVLSCGSHTSSDWDSKHAAGSFPHSHTLSSELHLLSSELHSLSSELHLLSSELHSLSSHTEF